MHYRLGILLLFVLLWVIPLKSLAAQSVQDELVGMITNVRSQSSLSPLTVNTSLQLAAQRQADYMAETSEVTHRGVDGRFVAGRAAVMGYQGGVGEVIYGGADTTPEDAVAMWMNSDTHIAIIMNGDHVEIGVGRSEGSNPDWVYWCVVFGTPENEGQVSPPTMVPLPLPVVVVQINEPTPVPTEIVVVQPAPTIIVPPVVLEPSPTPEPTPTARPQPATPTDDPVRLASVLDSGGDVRDTLQPVSEIREAVGTDAAQAQLNDSAESPLLLERITPDDPVPMIITISALVAAVIFIYLGYQSPPQKRNDPFRRW